MNRIPWKKTKKGLISSMYDNQVRRSVKKGFNPPTYSKKWLQKVLLMSELYHKLYDIWYNSGFDKNLVPSINRKDDYIGYTEWNIDLMTWDENNKKGNSDIKCGKNNKISKEVSQINKNGIVVAIYYSGREASRQTGISATSIANSLSGLSKSAGGYIWKYSDFMSEKVG